MAYEEKNSDWQERTVTRSGSRNKKSPGTARPPEALRCMVSRRLARLDTTSLPNNPNGVGDDEVVGVVGERDFQSAGGDGERA